MKTVLLAGGFGTRLSEETSVRPKPMVEIGGMPILWHIMKMYSAHGFTDFIICLGYKGHIIKKFFLDYFMRKSNVDINLKNNEVKVISNNIEPWRIKLIDTGLNTMTGGRIKRIKKYINNERFFLSYGDGVSDVNFNKLLKFHKKQNTYVTFTAVQPPGRYGAFTLKANSNLVSSFREKPKGDSAWINGGFFVIEPEAFDFIDDDATVWENNPMEKLAHIGKLSAYQHDDYWQNMDSLRDKKVLEEVWSSGNPPWKKW